MISQLVPRLTMPIKDCEHMLTAIASKKLLPVLDLLLSACQLTGSEISVIRPLTINWLFPYTFPTLRAAFSDKQLLTYCNLAALEKLRVHGVSEH
jgi:hypothetical protein